MFHLAPNWQKPGIRSNSVVEKTLLKATRWRCLTDTGTHLPQLIQLLIKLKSLSSRTEITRLLKAAIQLWLTLVVIVRKTFVKTISLD